MQELALSSGRNLLRPSLWETPLRTPFWDSLSTRVFCILIRTHPSRATRRTGRPRWILEEKFSGKSISVDTLLKCLSPEYRANFLFFLFRYESSLRITWADLGRDSVLAKMRRYQDNFAKPGRGRGNGLGRGLDTHRSISDTGHMCLLERMELIFPSHRGTCLSLLATD